MGAQYPVLSAEVMHLDCLAQTLNNPKQVAAIATELMGKLEAQLASQNAIIESVEDNVITFSFREGTLGAALSKALKVAVALGQKSIQIHGLTLSMRVGMDVATAAQPSFAIALAERQIAQPGQIVVSPTLHQMTHAQIPYETLGPFNVQGAMRTFYRLRTEQLQSAAPSPQPAKTEAPAQPVAQAVPPAGPAQQAAPQAAYPPIERKILPREAPGPIDYQPPVFYTLSGSLKQGNIGYQQAQNALQASLQEMLETSKAKGRIFGLCGAEGSGKSAIVGLVLSQLPADAFIWLGGNFFERYTQHPFPLYYWVELVHHLLGIPFEGFPRVQGEEHLRNVLKSIYGDAVPPEMTRFLYQFLNLLPLEPISPQTRQYMGQIVPHLSQLLAMMAQAKPLVIVMEDVHYADPASLELLLYLVQHGMLESRIAIVLTYTPQIVFAGPMQQLLSLSPFQEYILEKADEATIISIAEPPLAVPWKKLPDKLRATLLESGSPLYVEESFRWLLMQEGFSIHPKTGKFSPEKKLKDLQLPENVTQIIKARFEQQEEACWKVLQTASVLGERFSTQVLSDLTQLGERFEDVLKFLWQNGFIVPDTATTARFRHHLIWQVVYASLTTESREKLHQFVADYLEKAQEKSLSINPLFAAYHTALTRNTAQALTAWQKAAVWLATIGSVTGANIAFRQVQALLAQNHPTADDPLFLNRLYGSVALVNLDTNPDYAKNLLLTVLQQFADQPSQQEEIQFQVFLAQAYDRLGAYPYAVSTLHRTLQSLPATQAPVERMAIAAQEVWFLSLQGNYQEALEVYDTEIAPHLAQYQQTLLADDSLRLSFLQGELARCRVALYQCDPTALAQIDAGLKQCNQLGEHLPALHFRLFKGLGLLLKGDMAGCQQELDPILAEVENLPYAPEIMVWWGLIVMLYHCELGDIQNASMLVPNTSYQAEQAKDYLAWCICQVLTGWIAHANGKHAEAQRLLEQAIIVSSQHHLAQPALMGWRIMAQNELALGNVTVAEQVCLRAIEVAEKPAIRNYYELYQLIITQAKILLHQGQLKEAGALLERYWPTMVKTGYMPMVADAAYLISELYHKLSLSLPEPHKAKYAQQHENFLQKAKTIWEKQGNKHRLNKLSGTATLSGVL